MTTLLFIAGGEDHIMPAAVNRSNAKKYAGSAAVTDYHEFAGRSHWTCAEPGWEEGGRLRPGMGSWARPARSHSGALQLRCTGGARSAPLEGSRTAVEW